MIVRVAVGASVFALAYDGGTYDPIARGSLGVAVWWAVGLIAILGLGPRGPIAPLALASLGLLAAFGVWTAASIVWAPSAELAVREGDLVALYVGVFALVLLLGQRRTAAAWSDGIALGLVAVAVLALVSRCFPGHLGTHELSAELPGAATRLSYPVGYWNGLGILLGLAVPLLLRAAIAARSVRARAAALVPLPVVAAAIYLTSSRDGAATALVGAAVFVVLTAARWRAAVAILVAAAGSAGAIAVLLGRDALVNGPIASMTAVNQGHTAFALIVVIAALTGALYLPLATYEPQRRPPRFAGWIAGAITVLLVAVAVVAAHPIRRFDEFKELPPKQAQPHDLTQSRVLSGRANGRWQFWTAAAAEFRAHPVKGEGAGSYEAWWAEHGSFAYFTRYAHSLYLQILGELGLVGLLLLGASFLVGLAAAVYGCIVRAEPGRSTVAAAGAAFVAFAVGAALDWTWELTVVPVVGIACLALAANAAGGGVTRLRAYVTIPVAIAALAIVLAEALPLGGEIQIRRSESAVARGDLAAARTDALDARDLEPWAASPYLQAALVAEADGRLVDARQAVDEAISRSPRDWRLWLLRARVETRLGDVAAARSSIGRAASLNPRSPIFSAITSR